MRLTILTLVYFHVLCLSYAFELRAPENGTVGKPVDVQWSIEEPGPEKNFGVILIPWPDSWGSESGDALKDRAQQLFGQRLQDGIKDSDVEPIRTNNEPSGGLQVTPVLPGATCMLAFQSLNMDDKNPEKHKVVAWPRIDIAEAVGPTSPTATSTAPATTSTTPSPNTSSTGLSSQSPATSSAAETPESPSQTPTSVESKTLLNEVKPTSSSPSEAPTPGAPVLGGASSSASKTSRNIGLIAGLTVGLTILLLLSVCAFFLFRRRRALQRKRRHLEQSAAFQNAHPPVYRSTPTPEIFARDLKGNASGGFNPAKMVAKRWSQGLGIRRSHSGRSSESPTVEYTRTPTDESAPGDVFMIKSER